MNCSPDESMTSERSVITLEQLVASGPLKVVWLVEHQDNRIWKQFPESLAYLVEQAHILNIKKNTHK